MWFRVLILALALPLGGGPARATELALVMAEQRGCLWCRRWDEEVGPEYPITEEGLTAPLRRVDIHEDLPDDLSFDSPLRITPTFVLMRRGAEVSRLEGYPGEAFFWGLLQRMIREAQEDADADG